MLLRYGKHINYLATAFILVTFFSFLLSTTWLHYSTPTTLTLLKASFWTRKKRTCGYIIWHLYTCINWSLHFCRYRLSL